MYLRLFCNAKDENEAIDIFESMINDIQDHIVLLNYDNIEKYWKFEEDYIIEVTIQFNDEFDKLKCEEFLKSISNIWTMYGKPVNEIIASKTTVGCDYIKDKIEMMLIVFSKEELNKIFPNNSINFIYP